MKKGIRERERESEREREREVDGDGVCGCSFKNLSDLSLYIQTNA